jgi:hypothetical protein
MSSNNRGFPTTEQDSFIKKLFEVTAQVQQQRQQLATKSVGDVIVNNPGVSVDVRATLTALSVLEYKLLSTLGIPFTMMKISATPLNAGADNTILNFYEVPAGLKVVITDIDLVYTATGSYRIRIYRGTTDDFIENTATDLHFTAQNQTLYPGERLLLTQGATVSGTGNVDGSIAGRYFPL